MKALHVKMVECANSTNQAILANVQRDIQVQIVNSSAMTVTQTPARMVVSVASLPTGAVTFVNADLVRFYFLRTIYKDLESALHSILSTFFL